MNSHESQPKLPTWIFITTYAALLGVALLIGFTSPRPFSSQAMLWMSVCVLSGMIVGLVPIIVSFERQKNETLDERQRALEALARTVHSSAEQISIATGGLHEIAELAQKNLRHAEHLPHKLQEKIAEFQAQLSVAEDTEKEELERELLALRTSESERLDSVSQRIAKSAADWTKLETATQQHLTGATEALAKLSLGTASAIGKAQVAAEQALTQARTEAARTIGEASGQATRAIEAARAAALAEIDAKFTAAANAAIERVALELSAKFAALPAPAIPATPVASPPPPEAAPPPPPTPAAESPTPPPSAPASAPAEAAAAAAAAEPVAPPPPKRPRKPRREEPPPAAPAVPAEPAVTASSAPTPEPVPEPAAAESPAPAAPPPAAVDPEPVPVPTARIVEIAPVTPATTDPFSNGLSHTPPPSAVAPSPAEAPAAPPAAPRKRAKRPETPPEVKEEPSLGLDLDDSPPAAAGESERVLTSDGATRLLVTAYIGIGNRLFIRGAGPGLSWDKGVPLQFVSIGKWRWETNDAATPVQFKLYKNDELECSALGAQTLDPGHQQEVTAAF